MFKRNRILSRLHDKREGKVYFIISGAKVNERKWWKDKLDAQEVKVLETHLDKCIERIENDERRSQQAKQKHIKAATLWWETYEVG